MNQQEARKQLEKGLFVTNDLALSSALLALDFILCDLDFADPKKASFVFVEDQELREAVRDYWDNKLLVNPRLYFNTLKDLKSRIYTHKYAS